MTADAQWQFVDSNVFVYGWRTSRGRLSTQVLQEFFTNVTAKLAKPMPVSNARRVVSNWVDRSASVLGCDVLWTEDLNPGQVYRGVRVANPFES